MVEVLIKLKSYDSGRLLVIFRDAASEHGQWMQDVRTASGNSKA